MNIVVTGSRGYIGSALCRALRTVSSDINVEEFDAVLGQNILDDVALCKILPYADCVIHLAAVVGYPSVRKNVEMARSVNVEGTRKVCHWSKGRVIFASALSNYSKEGYITEDTPVEPKTEYAEQKIEAEKIVMSIPFNVVLRFGSLYGVSPNMRWDLLVHNLIRDASEKGRIEIFQPENKRALSNLEDILLGICFFALDIRKSGGIYNVVSVNKKKIQIAKEISNIVPCDVVSVPGHDPESRNYSISTKKIKSLGFRFNPNFKLSIKEINGNVCQSPS